MLNRFDEVYEIRLAKYEEIPEIMDFIDKYWKKGHIFARDRKFFEYEMVVDGSVNFLIAKTKDTGHIDGILGFLPCSRNMEKLDVWGVVWKVLPEALPMLGMELKKRLIDIIGARTELGVGANEKTSVPLLKRIYHYYAAKMKHYYRLAEKKDYIVAKIVNRRIPEVKADEGFRIHRLETAQALELFYDFDKNSDEVPYKDFWYYHKRFYCHPVYHYDIWGLEKREYRAVMVTRIQECNGSSVVRIVDFCGDQPLFGECGVFFDSLLQKHEYIDFYFDGFDEAYVRQAGMIEVSEDDQNIIPNHFYPFEQRNVDIYVDSSNNKDRCLFFLADGDQDRPN